MKRKALGCAIILLVTLLFGVSCNFRDNIEAQVSNDVQLQSSSRLTITEDASYQKDVMYFLFVDRFYDGNALNNAGNNSAQYDSSKTDWKKYWGGDLAGVNQKLDYLK